MKTWQLGSALALGLGALAGSSALLMPAEAPELEWRGDYEAARAEARQSGKPLFVAFR